tara:strand:+ start:47 stop:463 length:417 start_codon:yes stop_codon:yes gene_type:complete
MADEPNMTRSQQMYEGLLNEQMHREWSLEGSSLDQYDERPEPCPSCGKHNDEVFDVWPDDHGRREPLAVCIRCWEAHGEPTQEEIDSIHRGHQLMAKLEEAYEYNTPEIAIGCALDDLIAAFGDEAKAGIKHAMRVNQ